MATTYDKASLVMIPSGYKDDKLYSVKPTDGSGDFTFSRDGSGASPATRVNASGLIEKGRENVLLQSNQFDTTWTSAATNASVTSGQSGYDGSSDAWKLDLTAAGGRVQNSNSTSGVHTFSVYAKAGTLNWVRLITNSVSTQDMYFDLANGVLGTSTYGGQIDATITSVGGGWYRCTLTDDKTLYNIRIYPAQGDGDLTATSGNIYIQDAQLEQGLVATAPAIETTTAPVSAGLLGDMPRLDYSGGATCPSLLLEPSRVNLLSQSEYFDTTPYSRVNASVTHNDTTSPEGVLNAAKLISSGGASRIETFPTLSDNTTYTASIFAKRGDVNFIMISFLKKDNSQDKAFFNLLEGTKGTTSGSPIDSSIEAVGDYYRVTLTINSSSGGTTPRLQYLIANTDNNVVTASGEYIYVYGAQLEEGSYPTSYIPSYGSASTRGVDDCEKLSATDIIGQTEGTLFLDFVPQSKDFQIIYQVRTTGSSNVGQIDFRYQSGNLRALGSDGGVTQFAILGGDIVVGQRYKCAVRYAENDVAFYVNGSLAGTDTSASFSSSSLQQISFSENAATFYPQADVKQALLFKTGLTNAELAALTTI